MSTIPPVTPAYALAKPENYLVWSILATLCCCVPTGIAAIVYAAQVDSKWATGDYAGATKASENAKLWSIVSLILGILTLLSYSAMTLI